MQSSKQCTLCEQRISYHSCALPCHHQFCEICISKWCSRNTTCPICGQSFTRIHEIVNKTPTGFIFSAKALSNLYETTDFSQSSLDSMNFQPAQAYRMVDSTDQVEQISPQSGKLSKSPAYSNSYQYSQYQSEYREIPRLKKLILTTVNS
ncbi:hypothetical protein TRFO_30407 [Tritrichomonas foetus]|uniref:RING-type domain-containing protein n=1 Tax=Tritrichomonas foetus TaxID=1144522 RepID=A0A1J4JY75_9EUKA|nr:hypothetical protein TRFO_30407 [Tritrichomonas foetus]|eukprot:OHT02462.1 hypothetical protein TRFO_30407 [Tritrichomonas foetus]